jgi:ABC-type Fe3+ transport system substrate-binding protein
MHEVSSRVNDTIAGVPMKQNNTEGQLAYIFTHLQTYGMTVNHNFLDEHSLPTPRFFENLSDSVFGEYLPDTPCIALANAPDSAIYSQTYCLILQITGWDSGWIDITRMAGNSEIYGGSVEAQMEVQEGSVGVCLSTESYGLLSQMYNPDCEYAVPLNGGVIGADPIAIASTSTQKDLAEGFVDFVLSPFGQALLLDPSINRIPVMREAFDQPAASGRDDKYRVFNETIRSTTFGINETQLLLTQMSINNYFESAITYSHSELVNCWKTMVDAFLAGNMSRAELDAYAISMGTPVNVVDPLSSSLEKFTLEYAIRINDDLQYNATYRTAIRSLWTTEAKRQYSEVQGGLESLFPWLEISRMQALVINETAQFTTIGILGANFFVAALLVLRKLE